MWDRTPRPRSARNDRFQISPRGVLSTTKMLVSTERLLHPVEYYPRLR